jgi:hypothetical protein
MAKDEELHDDVEEQEEDVVESAAMEEPPEDAVEDEEEEIAEEGVQEGEPKSRPNCNRSTSRKTSLTKNPWAFAVLTSTKRQTTFSAWGLRRSNRVTVTLSLRARQSPYIPSSPQPKIRPWEYFPTSACKEPELMLRCGSS